ncbi:two-component sensor histidine kinase [Oceanobacillus oncorhynchi subsp. incaldanensis]|uniref:Heme sensor protein HssS n=2 Tax=Oceanobacillus TaxID=182709 RepID=A0A0A1ML25_9BACI|nr:HAMP domain-containing sensor histidine kinase [Oceanobacillus oncorhynchi]MDM8099015.1 HAMP domain-containing sensor histidine kinase [Oceanobacillus oncorhynchi]UUI39794.1 HAMP domain-containing histidine kinase [Oceanobacillus oncorhynchi]GIO20287.1 two-component sensor histidine kinase [Oceanobacillus oncorhynchi subsp. incaldanensis]CEI80569.1 Heme sensor protein HssS [Oceanobacillus oncorhynchi]
MRSLYVKFAAVTIGIMLLSGVIAFFISNTYYQHSLKPQNDAKNTEIALDMAAFIENNPEIDISDYLSNIADVGYQLYLVDNSSQEQFFGAAFRENNLESAVVENVLNGEVYHGMLHFPQETFVTGFFANELKNSIGVPLTYQGESFALFIRPDIKLLFNEMHLLFGVLFALTIILSILFVLFSTNYLIKPISRLSDATKQLAKGDFQVNALSTKRKDELGELSSSFSQMAKQIVENEQVRKEFVSNISHDIQSPLSNIKGYTNLLEDNELTEKDRQQYISIINEETGRLSTMTDQLLLLASLDHEKHIVKKKHFNVSSQLKNLLKSYQWLIHEKEIMLSYTLPDLEIYGDPSLLNTVWDNLLSNALKYNQSGGSIDIQFTYTNEQCSISFTDTGIGISEEEAERIFDRFYRADASRTRSVKGTGLGLSIVATIIDLHGGTVIARPGETAGTIFIVTLPISN